MGLDLRCEIGKCHVIDFTAVGDQVEGNVATQNRVIGLVAENVKNGVKGSLVVSAPRVVVPKAAVLVHSGLLAYFDSGASKFTNVKSSNRFSGIFNEEAALNAATAEIFFTGLGS